MGFSDKNVNLHKGMLICGGGRVTLAMYTTKKYRISVARTPSMRVIASRDGQQLLSAKDCVRQHSSKLGGGGLRLLWKRDVEVAIVVEW